ncbi:MAG TPA: exosortase H, partial [Casimicrobiaceae bacterium]|nr:exosortase H [Casimicrobiaceae bacterium]
MRKFLVVFLALLAVSFCVELTPLAQAWLVDPWTDTVARMSGALMRMFDGSIVANGNVIGSRDGAFAVSIEAGC